MASADDLMDGARDPEQETADQPAFRAFRGLLADLEGQVATVSVVDVQFRKT